MRGTAAQDRAASLSRLVGETRIVVFDVDGTLYSQGPVRRHMARIIATELLWSREGRRKIRIIRAFRTARERLADEEATEVLSRQYVLVSEALGVSADEVRAVTSEWLEVRPLPVLARFAAPGVDELFLALRAAGKMVAVLSDYPAKEKLEALGLSADLVVSATDPNVDRFKPQTAGLQTILDAAGQGAQECLLIGDRDERDGECARRAGACYLIKVQSRPRALHEVEHFGELVNVVRSA